MQTVAETPAFSCQADKLFNEGERRELIDYLAEHPLAGSEIPGTPNERRAVAALAAAIKLQGRQRK